VRDEVLIDALVELCDDAETRDRAIESIDSWARHDRNGHVAATKARLLRVPAIAAAAKPGNFLFVAGSAGWGIDLDHLLPGFVREAEPLTRDQRRQEAQRFLDLLLLSEGTAPMQVRTTLAGVQLEEGLVVNLPFGRLRAALSADFSAEEHLTKLPPAAVFEYEANLPARFGSNRADPFAGEAGAGLVQEVEEQHDRHVARVLLALVLAQEGPVQEHLAMRAPRYVGGGSGMSPLPLAPIVVSYPCRLTEGVAVNELARAAGLVAEIPIDRLGVVARRYLMAVTERTRPTDQIVDCSIAFEALTGTGRGRDQGKALAVLIGEVPAAFGDVANEHKVVKDARDAILHEGKTPRQAAMIASKGRALVRLGLAAAVRQAIQELKTPAL
jgi:hypothetical protein